MIEVLKIGLGFLVGAAIFMIVDEIRSDNKPQDHE